LLSSPLIITDHAGLATTMHGVEKDKKAYKSDPQKLGILFKEMIQICLWYTR
jgi:hypothetical protein